MLLLLLLMILHLLFLLLQRAAAGGVGDNGSGFRGHCGGGEVTFSANSVNSVQMKQWALSVSAKKNHRIHSYGTSSGVRLYNGPCAEYRRKSQNKNHQ